MANTFDFYQINTTFQDMGIYEVVLPFLLCFTIMFAFLEKTQVLGKGSQAKKFNIVISIVMGLLLVRVQPLVEMINNALPKVSVVIVAIVMFFIIIAMFNGSEGTKGLFSDGILKVVVFGSAVFIGWAFWSSYTGSYFPEWLYWVQDNLATLIVLGVFAGILLMITGGDNNNDDKPSPAAAATTAANVASGAAQQAAEAARQEEHH